MATAYSKRDVNRFSKTYRYVRQAPRFEYQIPESSLSDSGTSETPSSVEVKILSFEGGSFASFEFSRKYATAPYVFVSPSEESMNVSVESISLTSAVIRSSTDSNGFAHVHVVSTLEGDGNTNSVLQVAKKIDNTRFTKIFPYVRKAASYWYKVGLDEIASINIDPPETEKANVSFGGSNTVTYSFTRTYSTVPIVILTPDEGMNVFIDSVNTSQVVVESSTSSNATVSIQIISMDT